MVIVKEREFQLSLRRVLIVVGRVLIVVDQCNLPPNARLRCITRSAISNKTANSSRDYRRDRSLERIDIDHSGQNQLLPSSAATIQQDHYLRRSQEYRRVLSVSYEFPETCLRAGSGATPGSAPPRSSAVPGTAGPQPGGKLAT